jgi:hypothetical protein
MASLWNPAARSRRNPSRLPWIMKAASGYRRTSANRRIMTSVEFCRSRVAEKEYLRVGKRANGEEDPNSIEKIPLEVADDVDRGLRLRIDDWCRKWFITDVENLPRVEKGDRDHPADIESLSICEKEDNMRS